MIISGKAWRFGDDVDTDLIIPARYLNTTETAELAKHCLEPLRPEWAAQVSQGDVIVAGRNFGCGSSREHAPLAIKGCGIAAVVAVSFARIFYRNAFNIGLPVVESPEAAAAVAEGERIEISLEEGRITAGEEGRAYSFSPIPDFMMDLIRAGGLIPWLRRETGSGKAK